MALAIFPGCFPGTICTVRDKNLDVLCNLVVSYQEVLHLVDYAFLVVDMSYWRFKQMALALFPCYIIVERCTF